VSGRHNEIPPDEGGGYDADRPGRPSGEDGQDWFTPRHNAYPNTGPSPYPDPGPNAYPNTPPGSYASAWQARGGPRPADEDDSSDWFNPRSPNPNSYPSEGAVPPNDQGGGRPPYGSSGGYGSSAFSGASDPGGYNPGFGGASDPGGYSPGGYSPGGYRSYPPQGAAAPPMEPSYPYGPGGPADPGDEDAMRRRAARRRRSMSALIGPLAGAIGLAVLLGVGVYALADSGGGCGGDDATTLNVAAAPDIAPVVNDVVSRFNDQKQSAGGHCVKGIVKTVEPSNVATLLSGQGSAQGTTKPDVWIPDSTLWPTAVQSSPKGARAVKLAPTRLAQSPLVVAMPRTLAAQLKSQGIIANPSWDNLLSAAGAFAGGAVTKNQTIPPNKIRIQILDPAQNSAGMETLILTRLLLTNDPHADTIFTAMVRSVRDATSPNAKALFASFDRNGGGRYPVLLTSEQSVWKYNQGHPREPAVAVYPVEGTMTSEYPYAVTTSDNRKVQAANVLEKAFGTDNSRKSVQALGFRTPDGRAGENFGSAAGVSPRRPRALPAPRSEDLTTALSAWDKLTLGTRMLSLVDISGSMAEKVPGSNVTRMEGILQVIQGGLSLYPDDTEIGQWLFSTNLNGKKDWLETVPIGPLGERIGSLDRRKQLLASNNRVRPKKNGDTGLNDSVLAAYKSVQKGYEADKYNFVLVFTDGKNDDPGGGISDPKLIATLKKMYDPNNPVQIIMIGFGAGVDRAAMDNIAKATNGVSFVAEKPQDVAKFFLEAISRRVCSPKCPGE
jgi:hypothetical protein